MVQFGSVTNPADIEVVLGVNNLTDGPSSGSSGQRIDVIQIIPHPAYDSFGGTTDHSVAVSVSAGTGLSDTIGLYWKGSELK